MTYQWHTTLETARRVQRSPGHLARLCQRRLQSEGFAQMRKPADGKPCWYIRSDWTPAHRQTAPVNGVDLPAPVRITIGPDGTVTIIIQPGHAPGIPAIGTGHREAVELPSKDVQRTVK